MKSIMPTLVSFIASIASIAFADTDINRCKKDVTKDKKHIFISDTFVSKINEEKSALDKDGRGKWLYCPISENKKCNNESIWFTHAEFAKYLVNYKEVTCAYTYSKLTVINDVQEQGFVVYTTN